VVEGAHGRTQGDGDFVLVGQDDGDLIQDAAVSGR
jgi:hypothetical protein